jgi:hypothetical protein
MWSEWERRIEEGVRKAKKLEGDIREEEKEWLWEKKRRWTGRGML